MDQISLPIEISARHVHLSQGDLERLFGKGYQLSKQKDLSQGQFATSETVTIKTGQGMIKNVRIVGPISEKTVVALAASDAYKLGITPPLKECENKDPGALITLEAPKGLVQILAAIIIQRHIHLSPSEANQIGLKDGDLVKIKVPSPRGLTFENVLVKINLRFKPAFRIDVDEANAAGVKTGDKGELVF